MKKKQKKMLLYGGGALAVIVLAVGLIIFLNVKSTPGKLDGFATCLKDKGALMYGAFWCPHCGAQKKIFGSSASLLPYVECSTADAAGELPVCSAKGIKGYPTWVFPDGSRLEGEQTLATLAAKTGCVLPQ